MRRVQEETRVRIGHAGDAYLRERLIDLDDLANRLLRHLAGRPRSHEPDELPEDIDPVARNMSAADLIEYDRSRLRGIVLEEGSKTAHVTIVARAFDVPMVGRVEGAMATIDQRRHRRARWRERADLRPAQRRDAASFQQAMRARVERKRYVATTPRRCRR